MGPRAAQIGAIGVAVGISVGAVEGRALTAAGGGRVVKDPEPLSVVVVIDDRAQVSPVVLDNAEREVARIYLHAGLKTIWRFAPAPAAAFTVRLIIQAKFLGQPPGTSEFLMGAAPPTTNDCAGPVYVFFDQVTGFSNVQRTEPWVVLGAVIAHEIGHRLLRHSGHSSEGLMRAPWNATDWEKASLGLLLLTKGEREAIQSTISNCGGRIES